MSSKTYPDSHYNEYHHLENDIGPSVHQDQCEEEEKEVLPNNKSLLDELFERNNEELSEFMESMLD